MESEMLRDQLLIVSESAGVPKRGHTYIILSDSFIPTPRGIRSFRTLLTPDLSMCGGTIIS